MPLSELSDVEQQRELVARTVTCPICNATVGEQCTYPGSYQNVSHSGRYQRAAEQGLVPPIPPHVQKGATP